MKHTLTLFAAVALLLAVSPASFAEFDEPVPNPDSPSGAADDWSVQFKGVSSLAAYDLNGDLDIVAGPITMECWVKIDDYSTYTGFMAYGASYKLGLTNAKELVYTHFGIVDIMSGVTMEPDQVWHHVAAVWEPGSGVTFYIDGENVAFTADTSSPRAIQNANLTVGGETKGAVPLTGSMDRARIHNAVLTAAQLDSVAATPKAPLASTVVSFDFNERRIPYKSDGSSQLQLTQQKAVGTASADNWEVYK